MKHQQGVCICASSPTASHMSFTHTHLALDTSPWATCCRFLLSGMLAREACELGAEWERQAGVLQSVVRQYFRLENLLPYSLHGALLYLLIEKYVGIGHSMLIT